MNVPVPQAFEQVVGDELAHQGPPLCRCEMTPSPSEDSPAAVAARATARPRPAHAPVTRTTSAIAPGVYRCSEPLNALAVERGRGAAPRGASSGCAAVH